MVIDAATPAVLLEGLRCRLGGRAVLEQVDLSVLEGELVTLVGPSGCGKSSLLRCIAGLERLEAGVVRLAGRDVTLQVPEKRRVGMVFQEHALFGHLKVDQNISFGLRHLARRARAARVAEMLELVQLGHLGRRYPHQLSGGERQRVALARALAPSPAVVLLDEPFGAIDEVLRVEIGREVKRILAASKTAAILVTHDRHESMTLGDRVAVMNQGRILQCDAPQIVYEKPATRFVADFLAVSSYLTTESGDRLLVRPHQIRVLPGGPNTLERVEFTGSAYRYTLRAPDGSTLVADHGPEFPLAVGINCRVEVIGHAQTCPPE